MSCANTTALEKIGRAKCTVFDFLTLQEATENFSEGLKIGEGGFGTVYKVVYLVKLWWKNNMCQNSDERTVWKKLQVLLSCQILMKE